MSELYIPQKHPVIKLEMQPDFPDEDLSEPNASMLKYIMTSEAGIDTEADRLQEHQRQIHLMADQALKILGIHTRYAEEELYSFCHGFVSFETINDMVHPPRLYDMQTANSQINKLFVDCRDSLERELEELLLSNGEMAIAVQSNRDHTDTDLKLADRHAIWTQKYPNTQDVIIELGERREETMAQLQARTAGAHLAFTLQNHELDS